MKRSGSGQGLIRACYLMQIQDIVVSDFKQLVQLAEPRDLFLQHKLCVEATYKLCRNNNLDEVNYS